MFPNLQLVFQNVRWGAEYDVCGLLRRERSVQVPFCQQNAVLRWRTVCRGCRAKRGYMCSPPLWLWSRGHQRDTRAHAQHIFAFAKTQITYCLRKPYGLVLISLAATSIYVIIITRGVHIGIKRVNLQQVQPPCVALCKRSRAWL